MKKCTQEDFCLHNECTQEQIDYFNVWTGFSLLCPDPDFVKDLKLYGDTSLNQRKSLIMSVAKCNNKIWKVKCASDEEIDEYIKDIAIETWTIQKQINWEIYQDEPVFYQMALKT